MVQTTFATLPDGLQAMALFDQAFAQCISTSSKGVSGPYTVLNTDAGNTLALGGNASYTVTVNAASTYTNPNFFSIITNTDAGRGKTINISGITSFILWPKQTFILFAESNAWQLFPRAQRWPAVGNIVFNVDPVLGNDNNDGLATGAGGALATIQQAISNLLYQVDIRGQSGSVLLADGTYTEFNISVFGLNGALLDINIGGAPGHAASVIWNVPAGQIGLQVKDQGTVTFGEITITGGTGAECLQVNQMGILDTSIATIFGNCPSGAHIAVGSGGSLNPIGHTITGTSYNYHIVATGASNVTFSSLPITVAAATFTNFILGWTSSSINLGAVTFVGPGAGSGSTGQKYLIEFGGTLYTNNRDPNTVLPGSVNGTLYNGNSDTVVSAFQSYSFLALPSSPVKGMVVVINDSTTNTWGANITVGGGGDVVLSWYNGSNWTVMGK